MGQTCRYNFSLVHTGVRKREKDEVRCTLPGQDFGDQGRLEEVHCRLFHDRGHS